ncbi:MAG TPA: hypothetical protein VFF72_11085, partial [Caldimonas sp.]|nr:hypothetical protein [Caldimonas sp.]
MRASAGGWIAASMLAWLAGVAVQLREPRLAPAAAYLAAALSALLLLCVAAWSSRRAAPTWRRQ